MEKKSQDGARQKVPIGQVLFDDVYLLLGLGLGLPIVSYVVWSLWDLAHVPVHP